MHSFVFVFQFYCHYCCCLVLVVMVMWVYMYVCVGLCWFVCMCFQVWVSASYSHRGWRMPLGVLLYHSLALLLKNSFSLSVQLAWQQQPTNPQVSTPDSTGVTGRYAAMPVFLCECWHLIV